MESTESTGKLKGCTFSSSISLLDAGSETQEYLTVPEKLLGWVLKILGGCSPLDHTKKSLEARLWYNKYSWTGFGFVFFVRGGGENIKIRENLLVLVELKQKLFRARRERESFMKQNPLFYFGLA